MPTTPTPRSGAGRDDGVVTSWIAITMLTAAIVIGVVLDVGGTMRTHQRVGDAASEAARAAGQALNATAIATGTSVDVDPSAAVAAAHAYLAAAGIAGTVTATGETVTVTTTGTYDAHLLGFSRTVTGHAQARVARAIGGTEQ